MTQRKLPETVGWGVAMVRIIVGVVFLMHGWQKLFVFGLDGMTGAMTKMGLPAPGLSAVLVSFTEFLGGLLLLLGLFTRVAALPVAFAMFVAVTMVHLPAGFFAPAGLEYPLTLLVVLVALVLMGPGELALDNILAARRKPESGVKE